MVEFPHLTPPSARTVRLAGSARMPFILVRSITRPPLHTQLPGMLWPPPRTDTSRLLVRAKLTALITSETPAQRAMSAGRLSTLAFQTLRASS